jgi:ribokinase
MAPITVVGSINRDVVLRVAALPRPGETVLADSRLDGLGGKGANQAVAAARLGASVRLVGAVGHDGSGLLDALRGEGVDVGAVRCDHASPSGLATVVVDASGENAIVVSPGSNATLRPADLPADLVRTPGDVVLVQQEIPSSVVEATVAGAWRAGGRVVLNPAPATPLRRELLERVTVLVPNQGELAAVLGAARQPATAGEAREMLDAAELPCAVVVTLGAAGALVWQGGATEHVAAPTVVAVDTVGAGDTFCGALAASLAEGAGLLAASRRATHAAALAVTGHGAQGAMPRSSDVDELMERTAGGPLETSAARERTAR